MKNKEAIKFEGQSFNLYFYDAPYTSFDLAELRKLKLKEVYFAGPKLDWSKHQIICTDQDTMDIANRYIDEKNKGS